MTNRRLVSSQNLALVLVSLALSLAIFEIGLRLYSPVDIVIQGNMISLPRGKRQVFHVEGSEKLDSQVHHMRNELGFRGASKPTAFGDHLSIIAVGGSTTECSLLSEGKTWPDRLGASLLPIFPKSWVNNAGLDGHSTFGHRLLLEQHVLPLSPKVILFMVGLNDRGKFDAGDIESLAIKKDEGLLIRLIEKSRIVSLFRMIQRSFKAKQVHVAHEDIDFKALGRATVSGEQRKSILEAYRGAAMEGYAQRLQELIDMSRRSGSLPVLITQSAVYGPAIDDVTGVDLSLVPASPGNGGVAWEVLELYNGVLRDMALKNGLPLIDLAQSMPKSTRYYYDYFHFTNDGAEKAAGIIASGLCPQLQTHFPGFAVNPCP